MENFFYKDDFYRDLESFINENFENESEIYELEEDKLFLCLNGKLEPIFELSSEWIISRIDDERFSESNSDNELDKITKVLNGLDFKKINNLIPKLFYENHKDRFAITKQDLINSI
jgi:hypothetical protein